MRRKSSWSSRCWYMVLTLCVSKGQGSEEVLWAGDWPVPAVSPSWTLYCLDVAGSDQHSHSGAQRVMASKNNMCCRIHLTVWVWSDSRVSTAYKALEVSADTCLIYSVTAQCNPRKRARRSEHSAVTKRHKTCLHFVKVFAWHCIS